MIWGGRETPTIIFISTPLFGVKVETIGNDSEAAGRKPGLL